MDDNTEHIRTYVGTSVESKIGRIIISLQDTGLSSVSFVVGRAGFPNVVCKHAELGHAVLFETPDDGIVEVRLYHLQKLTEPVFRVARVAPTKGIAGGLLAADLHNEPFDRTEIQRIRDCIEAIKDDVNQRTDLLLAEQIEFLGRKLDELADAATRMGRKDWTNLAAGILTNAAFGAALSSDAARFLFNARCVSTTLRHSDMEFSEYRRVSFSVY